MAEAPLIDREQWAAMTSTAATLIAQHNVQEWYALRATKFEREKLAMMMMSKPFEARGCAEMAKRLRYMAHVEKTNP